MEAFMGSHVIQWQVDPQLSDSGCGHGLCLYAGRINDRSRLVAFIEGFGWLHSNERAVIRYLPELAQEPQFAALQAALESLIRSKKILQEQIAENYWCGING